MLPASRELGIRITLRVESDVVKASLGFIVDTCRRTDACLTEVEIVQRLVVVIFGVSVTVQETTP